MTVVQIKLEVPGDADARALLSAMRAWCDDHPGWSMTETVVGSGPPCPVCGEPMAWEPQLQTHVCHHTEE